MTHGSLFSGIGGFDIAAEWAGWTNIFHCEIEPFCQKVLQFHFPKTDLLTDIKTTNFKKYANRIDVLSGGFPCQPFSHAGKRKGTDDNRYLWEEMLRAIQEIQPRWVVGENVYGLVNWSEGLVFEQIIADLEIEGYEVQPVVLPACGVNAPHKRERIFFIAYAEHRGDSRTPGQLPSKSKKERVQKRKQIQQPCKSNNLWGGGESTPNGNSAGLQETRTQQQTTRTEQHGKLYSFTPNSKSIRRNERSAESSRDENHKEKRSNIFEYTHRLSIQPITADTMRDRLQRSIHTGQNKTEGRKNENRYIKERISNDRRNVQFGNFPTQPPICSRNDGLPTELDGITFPKWRQESIKAYGNAVVPQVVYQIFKVINKIEKL